MSDLVAEVRASGSSFYWPIRLLPPQQRQALAALYLFCHAVDDIADGALPEADKRHQLELWRRTADTPAACPEPRLVPALTEARDRFGVPAEPLRAIVDGCAMDLPPGLFAPDLATLRLYCSRVAGAVGIATVRLLGCDGAAADGFALATGEALQLTNILRDVAEDATDGRLYLPRELLEQAGIPITTPAEVIAHPHLPRVLEACATLADARFAEALEIVRGPAFTAEDRRRLRPAVTMLALYRALFETLRARGWERPGERPRLPLTRLLGVVLRYRFFDA